MKVLPLPLLAILLMALGPLPTSAAVEAKLMDSEFRWQTVMVQSFGTDRIRFFDADRNLQQRDLDQFLRIVFSAPDNGEPAEAAGPDRKNNRVRVVFNDGQRLTGRWVGAEGDALQIEHDQLGRRSVSLDDLRRVEFVAEAAAAMPESAAEDTVTLANGDRLTGFVAALTPATITIETGPASIDLKTEQVRSVQLANPGRPAPGDRVFLRNGDIVITQSLRLVADRLTIGTGDDAVELAPARVARIDLANPNLALRPLAGQPMSIIDGGEAFGVAWPPKIDPDGIRLHAPVTVQWEVPAGARWFAADARLDLAANHPRRDWAGFELILRSGDQEQRYTLDPETDAVPVRLKVTGGFITVTLEPGVNGPILDRLRLQDATLLVTADPAD